MVSSSEGFLCSEDVAFGRGRAGAEHSINVCRKMSVEGCFSRRGGGEYNESSVE